MPRVTVDGVAIEVPQGAAPEIERRIAERAGRTMLEAAE